MVKLYYSLVYSHLTYALLAWGRSRRTNSAKIECDHRRARKLLTDYNHRILTFHSIYDYFALLKPFNTNTLHFHQYFKDKLSSRQPSHFFLVGVYHIWSYTDFERKSLGLVPVINTYQLHIHSDIDIINVTVGSKNCCIISKIKKKTPDLRIYTCHWYTKERALGPTPSLWNPQCNIWQWHRGTASFDWDILFPVTQIRLKPVLHDTSDAIMQELTYQYVMINCVECFWGI